MAEDSPVGVDKFLNEDLFMLLAWACCNLEPFSMLARIAQGELQIAEVSSRLLDISPLACVCKLWNGYCHRFIVANFSAEPFAQMKALCDYLLFRYVDSVSELSIGPMCRVTNYTLSLCTRLSSLRLLGSSFITDSGLAPIASQLTSLAITSAQGVENLISNNGVKLCTNLTTLDISGNAKISDAGVRNLKLLTTLSLAGGQFSYMTSQHDLAVSDKAVKLLRNITSLNLSNNQNITDHAILHLPKLRELDLSYTSAITNRGLMPLTNLTKLSLRGNPPIYNEAIVPLVNLTFLDLNGNERITDKALFPLTNLQSLILEGSLFSRPAITDYGLKTCTRLTSLILTGNKSITDDGVSGLRNLTSLNLGWSTTLTDELIEQMKFDNPGLSVIHFKMFTDPFL